MKKLVAIALAALSLAACSFQNKNEREADRITRAVINNDMSPVIKDFDPSIKGEITRVRVAELSDELKDQGDYQGLKQTTDSWCPPGDLCFDVKFAKKPYREVMKVGSDGKVTYWWIRAAQSQQT